MESYRQVEPLVRFANSWTLVEVPPDELTIEGRLMGDCLADPANHHMIRRLLSLRYENGLSQRRISASAAMPQQTVSNRLRHSLNLLSREIAALSSAS